MGDSWVGSNRRARLPVDWRSRIRPEVFARPRGRVCALRFAELCTVYATEVDHIRPGDDHSPANLQPVCRPCHLKKSADEAAAVRPRMRRPPETHPAL